MAERIDLYEKTLAAKGIKGAISVGG